MGEVRFRHAASNTVFSYTRSFYDPYTSMTTRHDLAIWSLEFTAGVSLPSGLTVFESLGIGQVTNISTFVRNLHYKLELGFGESVSQLRAGAKSFAQQVGQNIQNSF